MKILTEKKVRSYELTFLVPASLTTVDIAAANTAVLALIKKHGLTIKDQEDWGKKELAYPIRFAGKNEREAVYTHLVIEADVAKVQAFEKDLYLQENVIRHLLVLAEAATTAVEELQA
jgi:small subunit ribosomal protein S6